MAKKDMYSIIAEYIKELYDVCKIYGFYLHPTTSYTVESISKYEIEQLMWSLAETLEIYQYTDPSCSKYKGGRITKNEIIDTLIDLSLWEKGELEL